MDLAVGSPSWGAHKQIAFIVTHNDNTDPASDPTGPEPVPDFDAFDPNGGG